MKSYFLQYLPIRGYNYSSNNLTRKGKGIKRERKKAARAKIIAWFWILKSMSAVAAAHRHRFFFTNSTQNNMVLADCWRINGKTTNLNGSGPELTAPSCLSHMWKQADSPPLFPELNLLACLFQPNWQGGYAYGHIYQAKYTFFLPYSTALTGYILPFNSPLWNKKKIALLIYGVKLQILKEKWVRMGFKWMNLPLGKKKISWDSTSNLKFSYLKPQHNAEA